MVVEPEPHEGAWIGVGERAFTFNLKRERGRAAGVGDDAVGHLQGVAVSFVFLHPDKVHAPDVDLDEELAE